MLTKADYKTIFPKTPSMPKSQLNRWKESNGIRQLETVMKNQLNPLLRRLALPVSAESVRGSTCTAVNTLPPQLTQHESAGHDESARNGGNHEPHNAMEGGDDAGLGRHGLNGEPDAMEGRECDLVELIHYQVGSIICIFVSACI